MARLRLQERIGRPPAHGRVPVRRRSSPRQPSSSRPSSRSNRPPHSMNRRHPSSRSPRRSSIRSSARVRGRRPVTGASASPVGRPARPRPATSARVVASRLRRSCRPSRSRRSRVRARREWATTRSVSAAVPRARVRVMAVPASSVVPPSVATATASVLMASAGIGPVTVVPVVPARVVRVVPTRVPVAARAAPAAARRARDTPSRVARGPAARGPTRATCRPGRTRA